MKKKQALNIKHINARSLLSCLDEVKLLIKSSKLDILCVSETWLLSSMPSRFVDIDGFTIYRCDEGNGGGACIYVRNELTAVQLHLGLTYSKDIQDIWLRVQSRKFPSVIVGTMYRHPKGHVDSYEYISNSLQKESLYNKPIFLFGDLNDDLLIPNAKLQKLIKDVHFHQIINEPTRITPTSRTLLDVIITNKVDIVLSSVVSSCNFSDHDMIFAEINIEKPPKQIEIKTFRSLKNYSSEAFCNELIKYTALLNNLLDTDDINQQVKVLTSVFMTCLNSIAPIVTKKIHRPPAPWMTDEIKREMHRSEELRKRRDIMKNDDINEQYRISKKRVKSLIAKAKKESFHERFSKCNLRKWDVIKDIIPNKKKTSKNLNSENHVETAEKFNIFFANVGKNVFNETRESRPLNVHPSCPLDVNPPIRPYFQPKPVQVKVVIDTILKLSNKQSFGSDGISSRFLKDSLPVLGFYLTVIVNTSIVTGVFPEMWKYALVNPLFKQGDPEDPSNFRPISILSTLSKVIERIVADQLHEFIIVNQLFSNTQHGFRKHLSTETALLKVTEKLYENIEKNEISALILCDLSKAFDSVSHSILLKKLNDMQIDSFWFEDYLQGRTQSVKINSCISSKQLVNYGVPQGSVLSPFLLNIFINDLHNIAEDSMLVQFADDAQFILSGKIEDIDDLIRRVESTVERALRYFAVNGLKVNAQKTQILFVGSKSYVERLPINLKIRVRSSLLSPSEVAKNLDIFMDNYLSFDKQVDHLCSKANGLLYLLNRQNESLDKKSRICVVGALINNIFSYCSIYGEHAVKHLLQKYKRFKILPLKLQMEEGENTIAQHHL